MTINQSLYPYDKFSVFSYTMTYGYRTLHTQKKQSKHRYFIILSKVIASALTNFSSKANNTLWSTVTFFSEEFETLVQISSTV